MGATATRLGYSRALENEEVGQNENVNNEEQIEVPVQPAAQAPAQEERSMFSLYFGTTQLFNVDTEEEIFGFRDDEGNEAEEAANPLNNLNSVSRTVTAKSPVNLLKTSLQLVPKEEGSGIYNLQFIFDSTSSGTVKVIYSLTGEREDGKEKVTKAVNFERGLGQTFVTDEESELRTQDFSESQLTFNESNKVAPVTIILEVNYDDKGSSKNKKVTSQVTTASILKCANDTFEIKPIKQTIQYGGVTYIVHDIYGIDHNTTSPPEECVICMSEMRDTVVIPCRHMCVCHQCAQVLRYQSNKCPICRGPVRSMVKISIAKKVDVDSESSDRSHEGIKKEMQKKKGEPTEVLVDLSSESDEDTV